MPRAAHDNTIYGDGLDMSNNTVGGNDEFYASSAQSNNLYGDGGTMIHRAKGEADLLVGGGGGNRLFGDADSMGWWAVGGSDTLIAGDGDPPNSNPFYTDKLWGDAREMSGDARGGDDRLIAGTDAVEMWGGAEIVKHRVVGGNDTFGHTRMYDFEKGKDHLEIDISGKSHAGQVSWEKLGSRISSAAGRAGGNFLAPAIVDLVRKEIVYREIGALIDEHRLYTNLLAPMPLCFNLLGPLRRDLGLATRVLHLVAPDLKKARVRTVCFEHSPERRLHSLTDDASYP